jgi:hypothetical protein
MTTSKKMQEVVTELVRKHGLDLTAPEIRLRLEMEGFDRLVIEKFADRLIRVAHYYEQRGDLIADPEILFYTNDSGWIPIEITQVLAGHRIYATLSSDRRSVALADPHRQADLAGFADLWAEAIELQGWLEHGKKWDPCDPTKAQAPDLETLIEWEAEGGCEAVDGCWVESDGTCPHGCRSWLLELGLV